MEIIIVNTERLIAVEGAICRVWDGVTGGGIECDVFVKAIRVRGDADQSAFERDLVEIPEPQTTPDPAVEDLVYTSLGSFIAYLNDCNEAGVPFDPSDMRRRIARRIAVDVAKVGGALK